MSPARAKPSLWTKASAPDSEPAMEAVWLSTACRPRVERPTFMTTTGTRRCRARFAKAS